MHNETHAETNSILNDRVRALFEDGVARSSAGELERLIDACTAPLVQAGIFDRVAVFLLNKAAQSLECMFSSGVSSSATDDSSRYSLSMADTDHLVVRVGHTGVHEYHDGAAPVPASQHDPLIKQFIPGRFAVFPLSVCGVTIGVLVAGS